MSKKADGDSVRQQNRNAVLQALRRNGAQPRVELSRLTGLSPATLTTISSQLIEEGLIEEINVTAQKVVEIKRGRPVVHLDLRKDAAKLVIMNVAADGINASVLDFQGNVIAVHSCRLTDELYSTNDSLHVANFIAEQLDAMLLTANILAREIQRIAVTVQGHADLQNGRLVWSPALAARDIPVSEVLAKASGTQVTVFNDANIIAEGLLARDSDRYGDDTICIFVGYGVGMGLIVNGQVYHGATGSAAEFGHSNHIPDGDACLCGKRGCLEAYVADYAIVRNANDDNRETKPNGRGVPQADMQELLERAMKGETKSLHAFEAAGRALGFGIGRLIAILNPSKIVLAGPGMRAAAVFEGPMRKAIANSVVETLCHSTEIEYITFAENMTTLGARHVLLREADAAFAAGPPNRNASAS